MEVLRRNIDPNVLSDRLVLATSVLQRLTSTVLCHFSILVNIPAMPGATSTMLKWSSPIATFFCEYSDGLKIKIVY